VSLPGTHPASLGPGARSRTATATGAPPAAEIAAEATPRLSPAEAAAAAAEASKRGLARLKAEDFEGAILELKRATELVPTEVNYAATLAWALFCHETDKPKIAKETRDKLREAIRKSSTPEIAQFYLGRVERMLGRDREARTYFLEVLDAQPKHAEAAAELRVIELRLRKR
jgi:tetratricopeptide (TPR) repeat protein